MLHRLIVLSPLLTALVALASPVPAAAIASVPPSLTAPEAALYDAARGQFLDEQADRRHVPVASLVKLMTARLLVTSGKLNGASLVPAGVTKLPQTKAGLVPGQWISNEVLLEALLIRSANDAALTVATSLAGSEPAFAVRMNVEAARLGLSDTHYVDSSGLDAPGQYSSARDVARLAALDLALAPIRAAVAESNVRMPDGTVFGTENPFLAYYQGADGVKTGFTRAAMFCLAASADRDGRTLVAVVLDEPSWAAADRDAARLLDWGFLQPEASAPQRQGAPVFGSPASSLAAAATAGSAASSVPRPAAPRPASSAEVGSAGPSGPADPARPPRWPWLALGLGPVLLLGGIVLRRR